jgi:anaerobic C4-dicarboxylate transporter
MMKVTLESKNLSTKWLKCPQGQHRAPRNPRLNGTQIAAAEADSTGMTTLGKRVIDHSFKVPLQIAWIVTALVGIAIVAVFH